MVKVLIVDPQRSVRNSLREKLEFEGYPAQAAENLTEAYGIYSKLPFGIIIFDGGSFGEYTSQNEIRFDDDTDLIVLSGDPSVDSAVRAIKSGAFDYIPKPVDMNRLLGTVRDICQQRDSCPVKVANSAPKPRTRARACSGKVEHIIGNSKKIQHVQRLIDKVAPSEARVLITGPNGTGKELVARWLHEKSNRSGGPFVEVNCAAIPSELIESELFGHEKGAFTSAVKQRKGKFEQANGGTLFLDEIGDMSLSAQAKVLRALQENRISRVGSDKDVEVDVRVLAATNKNLREEIEKGNFREDLYHRLSVIVINVPALAQRKEDIPLLAENFIEKICGEYCIPVKEIDAEAIAELKKMPWTGNVRELKNVVERLIILSGDKITCEDVKMYAVGTF